MEKQITKSSQKGKALIIMGFVCIGILFLIYSSVQNLELTPDALPIIERIAIGFYLILLMSFGAIAYGLYRFHKQKAIENNNKILTLIAKITFNSKSRKIFLITFVLYGIFFSVTSGILVYQPEVTFSYHYGATIPSAHITPCCGEPGYMPEIIVYLTEHMGLQIIPINLVLQIVVSYLVGLNVALAFNAIYISKKAGGLSGIGATTGLFIACPTCVGTFLSLFVSASSTVAFTVAITQIQTIFILITIPVLLTTPFIMGRKLKIQSDNCKVDSN
jgi:hypothetical protein